MLAVALTGMFAQITLLMLLAVSLGLVASRVRQPLIVAFILVGILLGPSRFGLVTPEDEIAVLGDLGLALLLFVVGLKLDLKSIRATGFAALSVGLLQLAVTFALGFGMVAAMGWTPAQAAYLAIALTFSSTIVVIKLLSDNGEADSLHGRIAVGVLIVQDVAVVLVMIALTALGSSAEGTPVEQALGVLAKGVMLLAGLAAFTYYILPRLLNVLSRSTELLTLFAVAWALAIATLTEVLGFSLEVGALLAGASLASTIYRELLAARLVTLRDFLLVFFFVELGVELDFPGMGTRAWMAAPLSLFALLVKPLVVIGIMSLMGYRRRTSFLTGISLAQISEFSLVATALGVSIGHIDSESLGLVTLVAMITIAVSSNLISLSQPLYARMSGWLRIFERPIRHPEQSEDSSRRLAEHPAVILFGLGRYGSSVAQNLMSAGRMVLGVDFDPQLVALWNNRGRLARFGDAEDPELPGMLPLQHARWVVSTVRERDVNISLLASLRRHGYLGNVAVAAYTPADAVEFAKAGASVVLQPYPDAGSQAIDKMLAMEQQEERIRMNSLIAEMKDHYIVCGYGRMGKQIVQDFRSYSVPFVVVEWNTEQLPHLQEHSIPHVVGRASEDETLLLAGVDRAKGLIAVTATDEENVFIVLTARGLNSGLYIVARSISEENEDKLHRAGADRVMSPYVLGGRRMASAVLMPHVADFLDLVLHGDRPELAIAEVPVCSSCAGKTLGESRIRETTGANVLALVSPDGAMRPNPSLEDVLPQGSRLIALGSVEQIRALQAM